MKTVVLFLCLLLVFCVQFFAQELDKTPQNDSYGKCEVFVEPDEANISLDISKFDKVFGYCSKAKMMKRRQNF